MMGNPTNLDRGLLCLQLVQVGDNWTFFLSSVSHSGRGLNID